MNPNISYGLWVIMTYQYRFINCNKCPTWCGMLILGKAMYVWGLGVHGKTFYFSLNFSVKIKLLLKYLSN